MLIDIVTNIKAVLTLKTNLSKIFWKLFDIFIDKKKFNMVSLIYRQHAEIWIPEMTRYTIKHALIFHDLYISFIKLWKYQNVPLLWVHYTMRNNLLWNIFFMNAEMFCTNSLQSMIHQKEKTILIITRSFDFKFFILSPNCAFSNSLAIFYMPNREIKYEK